MINSVAASGVTNSEEKDALKKIQEKYSYKEKNREPVKKLGKDEFFKIMVSQLQNQDPSNPYNNEQMAAQMAQFTALEQMVNVNKNLEQLKDSQNPIQNLAAANIIGKYVTVDSNRVDHTEGRYSTVRFDLPVDTKEVKVAILDQKGQLVRELQEKDLKKGPQELSWDGLNSNRMPVNTNQYLVRIVATTEKDKKINIDTRKQELVQGVGVDNQRTVLYVGDNKNPTKVDLSYISEISSEPMVHQSSLTGIDTEKLLELSKFKQLDGSKASLSGVVADSQKPSLPTREADSNSGAVVGQDLNQGFMK